MVKVKLLTSSGHDVADVEIPPFNKPPDVLGWGTRVFTLYATHEDALTYRECFSYAVPVEREAPASKIETPEAKSTVTLELLDVGRVTVMRQRRGSSEATGTGLDDEDTKAVHELLRRIGMEF